MKALLIHENDTLEFIDLPDKHREMPFQRIRVRPPVEVRYDLTPEAIIYHADTFTWCTQLKRKNGRVILDILEQV
jgi:hypothetical protein